MASVLFLCRRLVRSVLLLLGISAVSFCLFHLAPGDYFDELRSNPAVSTETLAALRKQHGLDEDPITRYSKWLPALFAGDWGYSIAYRTPVAPLLLARARNTLILTLSGVFCAWVLAIPLAVWTVGGRAWRRWCVDSAMATLMAAPNLLILLVIMYAAAHWRLLPIGGMTSVGFAGMGPWERIWDVAIHLAAPGAVLMLGTLPTLFLHTRAALLEVLDAPFIRFAQASGIPRRRILARHALPAAANPLITLMGLSIGTLLSSSVAVEAVAGWPGLGQLLLQSILQRDIPVVAGAVMLSAMLLLAANLIADLLLYVFNPGMRKDD